MKISLDFDDFSLENNNFFYLKQLKELYPDIKFSMFYIPVDQQYKARLMDLQREAVRNEIANAVKEGWMELIPHGLMHIFGEFKNASYEDMEIVLKAYEEHFKELDVPYVKGFKAPNWLMSTEAIRCLNDKGWFLAIDRNQPETLKAKRNYVYNWSIDEPFPKLKLVKGHGHISEPSLNSISLSFKNLVKIPHDYKWVFVSELMKRSYYSKKAEIWN
ncbi:MAG: DUF2334 domain-containing protein [Nitrospiria bacterium]